MDKFITKDSGERESFPTGMVRDTSTMKARYDLIYLPMLKRWAELMARGAKKYGDRNWELAATKREEERFKESAFRHFMQWFANDDIDEDHAAAVFFNISGAEMVKGKGHEAIGYPLKKEEVKKLVSEGYKIHVDALGFCECSGPRAHFVIDGKDFCNICKRRVANNEGLR
jgi:hypothetical protein